MTTITQNNMQAAAIDHFGGIETVTTLTLPMPERCRRSLFCLLIPAVGFVGCVANSTHSTSSMEQKGLTEAKADFRAILTTAVRSPEIPESADAYGWLVGSWELDVLNYGGLEASSRHIKGEAHFGWVLEGRAVQDVWIMPRRSERTSDLDPTMNMFGTTLRVWDSSIRAWRITWTNPAGNHHEEQIGGWSGKDVVQLGTRPNGTQTRWRFTEITPDSFHWLGEAMQPDGAWKLEGEFRATRMR